MIDALSCRSRGIYFFAASDSSSSRAYCSISSGCTVTSVFSMSSPVRSMCSRCSAASFMHQVSVSGWPTFSLSGQQRRMRQRDHALLKRLAARRDSELHVHGIGVADGNAGLEPAKVHLPGAAERVGPGFETRGNSLII